MTQNDDDLPGMLAVAKGVAEQTWPHTMDAKMWADEFVRRNSASDHGTMLGWFANAIMAGYDTAQSRAAPQPPADAPVFAQSTRAGEQGLRDDGKVMMQQQSALAPTPAASDELCTRLHALERRVNTAWDTDTCNNAAACIEALRAENKQREEIIENHRAARRELEMRVNSLQADVARLTRERDAACADFERSCLNEERERLRSDEGEARTATSEKLLRDWCDVCAYAEIDALQSSIRDIYDRTRFSLAAIDAARAAQEPAAEQPAPTSE